MTNKKISLKDSVNWAEHRHSQFQQMVLMSCLQAEVRFYYLDPNVEKGLPGISKLPIILKSVPRNLYHQPNMACSMCSFYRIAVLIEV